MSNSNLYSQNTDYALCKMQKYVYQNISLKIVILMKLVAEPSFTKGFAYAYLKYGN